MTGAGICSPAMPQSCRRKKSKTRFVETNLAIQAIQLADAKRRIEQEIAE
jgi:hypothetical protein